jgi:hypothetical protein
MNFVDVPYLPFFFGIFKDGQSSSGVMPSLNECRKIVFERVCLYVGLGGCFIGEG